MKGAHPVYNWEVKKQRYNTKYWTPKKLKNGKGNKGKISHDIMDQLYFFSGMDISKVTNLILRRQRPKVER